MEHSDLKHIDQRFNRLEEKFDEKHTRLEEKFDEKFNRLEEKFDEKLNRLEEKFDEKHIRLDEKFNHLEKKFNQLEKKFDQLEKKFDDKTEETKRHMDMRFEEIKGIVRIVAEGHYDLSRRLDAVESDTEKLKLKVDEHDLMLLSLRKAK